MKNKLGFAFFLVAGLMLVTNVVIIVLFSLIEMNSAFYNALNVSSLVIAFVSFVASTFFSFLVYLQPKNQNKINEGLPKKDDQYIISNYSLFNIENEISFFSLHGDERDILLHQKKYLTPSTPHTEDAVVRLVFLPTNSMNMPTYKVLCRSIDFVSSKNETLYSATAESPLDGEYSANILNRGYNCICVDLLGDFPSVQNAFSQSNHLKLMLEIISVFNVKMTVMYDVYLDSEKDVSQNPDKEKIEDLSTYIIHHTNYTIEEKSILQND